MNHFPHKLLLTITQVSKLRKAFKNNSSAGIKLSKNQLHRIGQSGGFLGRLLGPLLKTVLPLMKNLLKLLAKNVLIPLGLTPAASATDAAIHKTMFGSAKRTLMSLNEEIKYIMKTVNSLEESGLLIKGVNKTIKNKAKKQKGGFLSMLSSTAGAVLRTIRKSINW